MSSTGSGQGPSMGGSAGLAAVSGLRWPRPSVQELAPDSGKPAALACRLRLVGLLSVPVALALQATLSGSTLGPRYTASAPSFLGSSWQGWGEAGALDQVLPQFPEKRSEALEGLQPDPTGVKGQRSEG